MQSLTRPPMPAQRRKDPAPSRWAYRWQRIWLTPLWRFGIRVVLPLAVLALIGLAVWADPVQSAAIRAQIAALQASVQQREEFRLTTLAIEGASPDLADAIRAKLNVSLPVSSFDVDLLALREAAQSLPAVADAQVKIRTGGLLQVTITERIPALVWRRGEDLLLIDAKGVLVAGLHARSDRADLPLVVGQGAQEAAGEALDILAAAGPIAPRIQGLVRIGARRWDIVLDHNQRLMLPQENPLAALDRALALDQAERLFDRDILALDLRHGPRPVLRLAPYALTLRQTNLARTLSTESSL